MNPYRHYTHTPRPSLSRLASCVRAVGMLAIVTILTGCPTALLIAKVAEQAACAIVPAYLPGSSTLVASICTDAAPVVNTVIADVIAAEGPAAASYSAASCKLTTITDGTSGRGSICDHFCGDMAIATANDPCPRVDAALKSARSRKPRTGQIDNDRDLTLDAMLDYTKE